MGRGWPLSTAVLAVGVCATSGQNYPQPIRSPATEDFDCTRHTAAPWPTLPHSTVRCHSESSSHAGSSPLMTTPLRPPSPIVAGPMRHFALEYARRIQPGITSDQLRKMAEALDGDYMKALNCTVSPPPHATPPLPPTSPTATTAITFYADARKGSDANEGTSARPFATVGRAVAATRAARASGGSGAAAAAAAVVLRQGSFHLPRTIELGAADSGLTIRAAPGEEVWLSGGRPLTGLHWLPHGNHVWVADLSGVDNVPDTIMGLRLGGQRLIRARFPNGNPELGMFGCIPQPPQAKGTVVPCPKTSASGMSLTVDHSAWNVSTVNQSQPVSIFKANDSTVFRNDSTGGQSWDHYKIGIGGGCAILDPPAGQWCAAPKGFVNTFGVEISSDMLPNQPYHDPRGAVMQVWHENHWCSWMWEVGQYSFRPKAPQGIADPSPVPWCPAPPQGFSVTTLSCVADPATAKCTGSGTSRHCNCANKQLAHGVCDGEGLDACAGAAAKACSADSDCHSFAISFHNCSSQTGRWNWETYSWVVRHCAQPRLGCIHPSGPRTNQSPAVTTTTAAANAVAATSWATSCTATPPTRHRLLRVQRRWEPVLPA
eukprot:COSAG01_NODE_1942_length_8842_cov_5.900492_2_plen_601_part_00